MNAKERALYIYDLFNVVNHNDKVKTKITRKACALILVNEIIKDIDPKSRDFVYWINVKINLIEL